jgi:hypothetical protein
MEQPKVMIIERNFADFKEGEIYVLEKDHYVCTSLYDKKVHKDIIPLNDAFNLNIFGNAEYLVKEHNNIKDESDLFSIFLLFFTNMEDYIQRRIYAIRIMELFKEITDTK